MSDTRAETNAADRAERRMVVRTRIAARYGRRPPWAVNSNRHGLDGPYVRCLLPRRPEGVMELHVRCAQEVKCGALVFIGEERSHEEDVHGGAAGQWAAVEGATR